MFGEPLLRLDETDSTNRVALDWQHAPHGAGVVARVQTRGRGRLGRTWESVADKGLYLSLVWRGSAPPTLSLQSALGVALGLERLSGLKTRIKWPNDVLVLSESGAARKIGGILGESRGEVTVIGIGINVNQNENDLPERPIFPASSLRLENGRNWEIEAVLQAILGELDATLNANWSDLHLAWGRHCFGLGEVVRVKSASEVQIGVLEGVDESGALLLRTAGGLERIWAGDVSYF